MQFKGFSHFSPHERILCQSFSHFFNKNNSVFAFEFMVNINHYFHVLLFQLVTDPEKPVIFYEWTQFLSKYFRKIPSLLTYHHFKCSIDKPGSIMVREYASDQEKEIKLLKAGVNICSSEQPCITVNPGLDAARMWYLYEEIRPYCPAPLMDKVCPRPSGPKPQVVIKCESKTLSKKKK